MLPSVGQAPKIDLKPFPEHLKYVYLGENDMLQVIIKKELVLNLKARLTEVLHKQNLAIGWILVDLLGVSPKGVYIGFFWRMEINPLWSLSDI